MNARKGFTLIEILIVVAIIAILASAVLVGLGPTQSLGRDSRRLSDLHEIQNGLELYYNANGSYPSGALSYAALQTALEGITGVTNVPNDPSTGKTYVYGTDVAAGTTYVLGANLENKTGNMWTNYSVPANLSSISASFSTGGTKPTCTAPQFCLSL